MLRTNIVTFLFLVLISLCFGHIDNSFCCQSENFVEVSDIIGMNVEKASSVVGDVFEYSVLFDRYYIRHEKCTLPCLSVRVDDNMMIDKVVIYSDHYTMFGIKNSDSVLYKSKALIQSSEFAESHNGVFVNKCSNEEMRITGCLVYERFDQ